jgi:hypothetical protein
VRPSLALPPDLALLLRPDRLPVASLWRRAPVRCRHLEDIVEDLEDVVE